MIQQEPLFCNMLARTSVGVTLFTLSTTYFLLTFQGKKPLKTHGLQLFGWAFEIPMVLPKKFGVFFGPGGSPENAARRNHPQGKKKQ